ncbi:MAG TPA: phasin [Beijerinckiaceae bacterium]|jgi:phasin
MAQQNTSYEVPPEMRDFAEKSVEQARKAFDGFMSAAQRTVDTLESSATSVQSNTKDLTQRTFEYAEQNVSAAFDLAQKLVRAKDVQEAMQLQAEYVRSQFAAMQTQMKEFGSIAQSVAQQAAQTTASQAREFGSMAQEAARSATEQATKTAKPKR